MATGVVRDAQILVDDRVGEVRTLQAVDQVLGDGACLDQMPQGVVSVRQSSLKGGDDVVVLAADGESLLGAFECTRVATPSIPHAALAKTGDGVLSRRRRDHPHVTGQLDDVVEAARVSCIDRGLTQFLEGPRTVVELGLSASNPDRFGDVADVPIQDVREVHDEIELGITAFGDDL